MSERKRLSIDEQIAKAEERLAQLRARKTRRTKRQEDKRKILAGVTAFRLIAKDAAWRGAFVAELARVCARADERRLFDDLLPAPEEAQAAEAA